MRILWGAHSSKASPRSGKKGIGSVNFIPIPLLDEEPENL